MWSLSCPVCVSTRVVLTLRCWDGCFSADSGGGSCLRSQASWAWPVPVTLEPTTCHSRTEARALRPLARPAPRHPARALFQKQGCLGGVPYPEPGGALGHRVPLAYASQNHRTRGPVICLRQLR